MRILFTGTRRGDLVEIGKIAKPQGIKGELKIIPFDAAAFDSSGDDELFVLADDDDTPARGYAVLALRMQGGALMVRLAGIDDRDRAEELRGLIVARAAGELPELEPDEIYWHQLAGLPARTADGRHAGRVADFLMTAAHPVLVIVDDRNREQLIPAHAEFVAVRYGADGEPAWLMLTPPPGLLEEDSAL